MNILKTTLALTAFVANLNAFAATAPTEVDLQPSSDKSAIATELKQSINLGFVNTSGNTQTTNLNSKYVLDLTTEGFNNKKLEVDFEATAFLSENNDIRDNEEYRLKINNNQFITDDLFLYTNISWMQNKFLNFDARWNLGAGIGKEFFKTDKHNLQFKIGVAHNVEEYTEITDGLEEKIFTSLTQYIEYNRNINKTSKFYSKFGISENFSDITGDYDFLATVGLDFKISEDISVILEEEIRYDSIPASEHKTDTKTLAKIGYSF